MRRFLFFGSIVSNEILSISEGIESVVSNEVLSISDGVESNEGLLCVFLISPRKLIVSY